MIAVCNTSPISNLIQIANFSLLPRQFDAVYVPPDVIVELDAGTEVLGEWRSTPSASALQVRAPTDAILLRDLAATLHQGEAAAIALTAELPAAVLVIDELDGRRTADRLGLRYTGTVGVLIEAKRRGDIGSVGPLLDDLRSKAGFWLSDAVVRRALELAGEL